MKPVTYTRYGGPRDGQKIMLPQRAWGGFNEFIDGVFHYYVAYGKELVLDYHCVLGPNYTFTNLVEFRLQTPKHLRWKRRVMEMFDVQGAIEETLHRVIDKKLFGENE